MGGLSIPTALPGELTQMMAHPLALAIIQQVRLSLILAKSSFLILSKSSFEC
jgi:hypothetical protein